jgi:hypothetical protein
MWLDIKESGCKVINASGLKVTWGVVGKQVGRMVGK